MYNNLNLFLITYIVLLVSRVNALSQQKKKIHEQSILKNWQVVYNFCLTQKVKNRTQQNLSYNYVQL